VLTAAKSAVMHIISADTIEADLILSIPYTQYRFQYDTDPIIVSSLIWMVNRSFSTRLTGYKTWAVLTSLIYTHFTRPLFIRTKTRNKFSK